jgi:hypothetical protein
MRALVALTAFMGILLLAGIGVVIVTIVHRATAPKPPPEAAGHARLALPPGAKIAGMIAIGERLELQISQTDGSGMLILLDPRTGAVLETIDLPVSPASVQP